MKGSSASLTSVLAGVVVAGQVAVTYADDTCVQGYVWREAFAGDRVCVTPDIRAQAAEDNRQAAARRQPGGGAYGPETCVSGYVWREARAGDLVCVLPQTRAQAAADNAQAPKRVASAAPVLEPAHEEQLTQVNERCAQYASRAVQQYRITLNRPKCSVPASPRWQTNYQGHYGWCLTAQDNWLRAETKARDDHLFRCGGQVPID